MTVSHFSFASLMPPERMILRLKALIGAATGKTVFMDCLNRVGGASPAWGSRTLNLLLDGLRAKRLLDESLACAPEHLHTLAVDAIASPDGAAMVAAIRAVLPPEDPRRYYDGKAMEANTQRWMRLAVLLNDEAEFKQLAELRGRYCRNAPAVITQAFAGIAVGTDWLASRTVAFQAAILAAKADRLIGAGIAAPDYRDLMEHCRRDPVMGGIAWPMVADFDVLNGRLASLAAWIAAVPAGVSADAPAAFSAVHALLSGEVGQAVARFAEALRLHRKSTRKRKGRLPGYVGLLHLCALIAADDAGRHAEIEAAIDAREPSLGDHAIRALLELARNREAQARDAVQYGMAALSMMPHPSPVSAALLAVSALLVDPAVARLNAARFVPLFRRFEHSVPLAAGMLAEVLEAVAGTPAPYRAHLARPDRQISFRFAAMIAAKAPWERALASIEAMLDPASRARPDTPAKTKRLVWQVDPVSGDVQPLEQSSQARGWSAGRAVALKRLHLGDPKLDYLDEFDRRAARTLRRTTVGWNNEEVYDFPREKTLPALVGHPRVFDRHNPAVAIDLVEARAELVLSSEAAGFRLALSHAATEPDAFIEVETPGRWRVVVVDAQAVAASAVLGDKGIRIPAAARERLAALTRSAAPGLPLRIEASGLDDGNIEAGDPSAVVRLMPMGDGLKVSLVVRPFGAEGPHFLPGIGGRLVSARLGGRHVRARRDLAAETRNAAGLAQACPSLGGDGPDWLFEDLLSSLEVLAELRALPTQPPMEWPEGQRIVLRGEATAKRFKASVKGGDAWFTLGGSVDIDEGLVLDLKDLLSRLDRAEGRFVPLDDGGFVALDGHFRAQLERLKRLGDGLKVPTAAGIAVRDVLEGAASLKSDARWRNFTRRIDEAEDWQPLLPAAFAGELRDYQSEGFAWMCRLARWGAGALLADDMGLGKTPQAIAVMLTRAADGPLLLVAPTSVCGNWQAELARFAPGLTCHRLAEADDRGEALGNLGPGDVVIVSYGLLAREDDRLVAITWAMAVLDEAQAIKNADTRRAKASQRLNAGFRLALTGTPVENSLDELWSLFRFVNPGLLGSREAFAKRFSGPIERDGDAGAKAALRSLVRPFLLRRTKTAVAAELPARTEQTLLIEMGDEERAFYEALRRRALEHLEEAGDERTRIHILAEITRLRQACCHPALAAPGTSVPASKLEALLDLVGELREGRHRALVFSQFVGHLEKVRAALDAAGVTYQYLDGATPARDRERRVAAFQAGDGDLFLISLKAGGFGLNLTAADFVIHLDPWWNPAVEDQASDRAHRIGQHRPVTIYRLIVKDTIEEGIVALHRRKRDLADALLEGADAAGKLSEEDLLDLIRCNR
ncbi:MAG: DEAD/DEAH box helicase [Magnetospirillum sp.]|nr:DEAD/DEAH box helicase [Magnetospirillum sp.]